ncbi:Ger(x)C family spore germination protein [Clostridium sp. YIM B02505]|uniref:Ger(X)C family spore germination protein n=1 Tax=Clostridium yunnanense TaxID=2800325 RepID=A0ABS1EQ49_9CLOT|nr:Ger(x)C family spore germination protein [Clostridium yunnanense]MBK1811482.1 Ger(x)C family spore germination protein [Clostridium yunnanense]
MKYVKNLIILFICILLSLSLTACWSSIELNKMGIVTGIALSRYSKEEDLNIIAQVGVPRPEKSSSGVGGNEEYVNIKQKGNTVAVALRNISREYNRTLFFAHNQVVVFGRDLAHQGIGEQIDFFLRNRETRPLTWMLVSNDDIDNILENNTRVKENPGISIGKLIKNEENVSQLPIVTFRDFTSKLMSKTTAPVMPIIELKTNEDKSKTPFIAKTAVFAKDKMIGELNEAESMGLLWGTNKIKRATISVKSPDENEKVTIRINRAKSKLKPRIQGDTIYMSLEVHTEGDIMEQTTSKDLSDPQIIKVIEDTASKQIEKEVINAFSKSKELGADIFGFGDTIYKYKPKVWKQIETKWDKELQSIRFEVKVDARVRRMGKITKPATFEGK